MVSDSIINASIPNASKDLAKKKRANRSAKLKQSKLDARREQWLSQVKNKKCGVNGGVSRGGGGQFNGAAIGTGKKSVGLCKGLEVQSERVEVISSHNDSDSETSPGNSPMSSVSRGTDPGHAYSGCSSSSCSFSFSSGGCCSGSITEEEEGEGEGESGGGGGGDGDDGCLDDWEAVADALMGASDGNQVHNVNGDDDHDQALERETTIGSSSEVRLPSSENVDAQMEKLKSDVGILGKGATSCRAWRPDDAFRPQSLPNLAKQRSFPSGVQRHHSFVNPWVRNITPRVPTSCPICCEDLDLTDSSFLPCPCGFHLCLFCHKRIIEEDGRCPGCRKPYTSEPVEKETTVSSAQGGLTFRLARSCSMSCSRA